MRLLTTLQTLTLRCCLGLHQLNAWVFIPALTLLVSSEITLRTVFNVTLPWSHELSGLLLLLMFFLSLPYVYVKNDLLKVDLVYQYLPDYLQVAAIKCGHLLVLLFSVLLTWQLTNASLEMYEFDEEAFTLKLKLWPLTLTLSFCALLMGLLAVFEIILGSRKSLSNES